MIKKNLWIIIAIIIIVAISLFFILKDREIIDEPISWQDEKNEIVLNLEEKLDSTNNKINERQELLSEDELNSLSDNYNEIEQELKKLKENTLEIQEFKSLALELENELSALETKIIGDLEVEFLPDEGTEAQEIAVVDQHGFTVYSLTLDELKEWMQLNWDKFEETPEVGGREVEVDNFHFFDRHASVSFDNETLVFSVHDYAVLTTTTFLLVVDLEKEEISMLDETIGGTIEGFAWSDDSSFLAFTLGTARAAGDYLSVVNIDEMNKKFRISGDDIAEIMDPEEEVVEEGQFMPNFHDLVWHEFPHGHTLEFKAYDLEREEEIEWLIDSDGRGLIMKYLSEY